ncbi:MAG: SAM-dependent methyltransferase [Ruminococcaceae bacterium]|nr:SAM-dependent methyltransferase [Oscillospiraceae bacterium]
MLVLTPRLQAVADFVQKGSVIADIGTDHAYIPAYLLQSGMIEKSFACDIRNGPLDNARQTIAQYRLSGVRFLLSDGLKALEGEAFDTIIIAGMGGEMISEILENSPWCHNKTYRFVLQPMTKADVLRRYLYERGFEIEEETFAAERDKLYSILSVGYCGHSRSITQAQALLGNAVAHPLFEQKRQRELLRLQRIEASLQQKKDAEAYRQEIQEIMQEIKEYSC